MEKGGKRKENVYLIEWHISRFTTEEQYWTGNISDKMLAPAAQHYWDLHLRLLREPYFYPDIFFSAHPTHIFISIHNDIPLSTKVQVWKCLGDVFCSVLAVQVMYEDVKCPAPQNLHETETRVWGQNEEWGFCAAASGNLMGDCQAFTRLFYILSSETEGEVRAQMNRNNKWIAAGSRR